MIELLAFLLCAPIVMGIPAIVILTIVDYKGKELLAKLGDFIYSIGKGIM